MDVRDNAAVAVAAPNRRLQLFRHLHSCPGCFRLEQLPGGSFTHWKAPPFHGAHPELPPAVQTTFPFDVRRPISDAYSFASGFATSCTQSMKSCAAGLRVGFLRVTIPTGLGRTGNLTGKTLIVGRWVLNRSTD